MEESIVDSLALTVAFGLGALVPPRALWVGLVASSGIGVAFVYWVVWVPNNGGFDKYPGEVLMALVFGVPLIAAMWIAAVAVGYVVGRLVRTRPRLPGLTR